MPFNLVKATVTLSQNEIESLVREAVEKAGYKVERVKFYYGNTVTATIEVEFPKPKPEVFLRREAYIPETDYKDK